MSCLSVVCVCVCGCVWVHVFAHAWVCVLVYACEYSKCLPLSYGSINYYFLCIEYLNISDTQTFLYILMRISRVLWCLHMTLTLFLPGASDIQRGSCHHQPLSIPFVWN